MPATARISSNRIIWTVLSGLLLATDAANSEQPAAWKTGAAFSRQLHEIVGLTWQDRALREGLERLSQAYGVAFFLDRRIDPDQHIDFTARDVPLENLWQQIAAAAHAETAVIGSVVYIGPHETVSQLATIAATRRQEVARLPNDIKARLLKIDAWHWDELAQPRDLLRALADQAGVSIENIEAVPHDLWPAVSLPPLAWVDRMTLLLAGFSSTFEVNERGTTVWLVPAQASAAVENRPAAGQGGRAVKPQKTGGTKLYSLNVENRPAGEVVRKIAESLGKELTYDPALRDKLKQSVTFNVKDVTLEYLMETTLKPLGLTYRNSDKKLEIVAQ